MERFRAITYGLSGLIALSAAIFPQYSTILLPLSTFIGGWATVHPADKGKNGKNGNEK